MSWQTKPEPRSAADPLAEGEPGAESLTIGQVRELVGVSARTLRYYEELDLLPGVRRRSGGRRVYGTDEVERLRFISRLKTLGLSLAEIKDLNAVYAIHGSTQALLSRLEQLLDHHLSEVDGRIRELGTLRDDIEKYRTHIAHRKRSRRNGAAGGQSP